MMHSNKVLKKQTYLTCLVIVIRLSDTQTKHQHNIPFK